MTTFVSLLNLTDQGIRNVKESPHRFEAFKDMAAKQGITVKAVYYTVGQFDMIVIVEGNEQSAIASLLATNALGNIRSQPTLTSCAGLLAIVIRSESVFTRPGRLLSSRQ